MRFHLARLATVVAMIATVAACSHTAGHTRDNEDMKPTTRVRVENQAFLDMNVYVVNEGGGRQRLGTATGNTNSTFVIPDYLLGPANMIRFICEPIGAARAPVSNSLTVQPGTTVVLTIPPNG